MGLFSKKKGTNNQQGGGQLSSSLHDEKQKSKLIVGAIDDAVILVDTDNIIQTFNPASEKLTGWKADEALGVDYRSVIRIADEKGVQYEDANHPIYKVFSQKKTFRDTQATILQKGNQLIGVDVSMSPLIDSKGLVSAAIGVIRDVHLQRKEEKQRADFISTASHEMRTPVAAIEGYLALAMNDKVCVIDEKAHNYLDKAHSSTQHLGKLFADLLTSAKAEDGRLTSHPQTVDIGEFVEKLVDDLRFSAEKKGLALELHKGSPNATLAPLMYANVDPDRMREVITNLFDNAVKYTESGKITIGITGDENVVQFHIADTGPGIPKEDVGHLFQKFYRVDNSTTRVIGGTGLGLFICQKIVELYSGKIWVESTPGEGSTFYINLPRLNNTQVRATLAEALAKESAVDSINSVQPSDKKVVQ
ncbi:MAG: two-component system sensor histidine kinase VicK [Candidatus Saccharimonadales bacterium]|jgi:two-component system sensor histidine kinase VicK